MANNIPCKSLCAECFGYGLSPQRTPHGDVDVFECSTCPTGDDDNFADTCLGNVWDFVESGFELPHVECATAIERKCARQCGSDCNDCLGTGLVYWIERGEQMSDVCGCIARFGSFVWHEDSDGAHCVAAT